MAADPGCAFAGGLPLDNAIAALTQAQYRDAEAMATSALEGPGTDLLTRSRLQVVRGLARQAQGKNEDALVDFTEALSSGVLPAAERVTALFDRGVTLDSLGHLADALGDYSAVLRLTPNASNALNNRANVYRRQGRLEDARHDYLAALADDAGRAQYPDYGLGQIAEAMGDLAAARSYYAKALAVDPGYRLAADRLAALGANDWKPADPEAITLRPPPAVPPIVLKPPKSADVAEPAALRAPAAPPKSDPAPRRQAPLRPAIVERSGRPDRSAQGPLAQLGAWRSETEAQAGWNHAQEQAGGLLNGLTPHIVAANLPDRGRYYRLQVLPGMPAAQFCAAVTARGLACFPVRP